MTAQQLHGAVAALFFCRAIFRILFQRESPPLRLFTNVIVFSMIEGVE